MPTQAPKHIGRSAMLSLAIGGLVSCQTTEQPQTTANNANAPTQPTVNTNAPRPNIVFVLADDMGYGDLGCYSSPKNQTPVLDSLAANGLRFTDYYSASAICSPSRAALLTGRYHVRMGINSVFFPESFTGMPTTEVTLPQMLKKAGYATGMVGKWHLGHRHEYLPAQRGFDSYFGIPYSNDMESLVYMRNNKVVSYHVNQDSTIITYAKEATNFIDKNAGKPFFLYFAHNMPHVPLHVSPEFSRASNKGLYADVISEIDWSVGQIVKALKKNGVADNTLIVFSSDNGPWLVMAEYSGSAGQLREGKQTTFEGGMRVPCIVHWPAAITQGKVVTDLATMMDWMPTLAQLAGTQPPTDRDIDGENIGGLLTGKGKRTGNNELLYYHNGQLRGFRQGNWKIKLPFEGSEQAWWRKAVPAHDTLLYDLSTDPGETNNLITQKPEVVATLAARMQQLDAQVVKKPTLVTRTQADPGLPPSKKNQKITAK